MAVGEATTATGGVCPARRASRNAGMSPSSGRWQVCSTPTSPPARPCRSTRSGTRHTTRRRGGSGWNTSVMRAHHTTPPGDRTIARAPIRIRRPGKKSLSIMSEKSSLVTRVGNGPRCIRPGRNLRIVHLGESLRLSIDQPGRKHPRTFHLGMVRLYIGHRERSHPCIAHRGRSRPCTTRPGRSHLYISHQESTLRRVVRPGKSIRTVRLGKSIAHPGRTTATVLGGRTICAIPQGKNMLHVHPERIILHVHLGRTIPSVQLGKSMYGVR